MKILVLGGGKSTEREVSLRSSTAVAEALKQAGYDVEAADPADGEAILDNRTETVVFPILHGQFGEDGVIQAHLEKRNLPYLGTMSEASAICFDKVKTLAKYREAGLPIAKGAMVTKDTYAQHELTKAPHVLKVSQGGSSIGTYLVHDPAQVSQSSVDGVFKLGEEAVIEELVEGVEITVPVLDDKALPVIEIQPPENGEFDYENKYNGASKEICPPISVSIEIQKQAQRLAEKAHMVMRCRHLSRTDMIVRPNGEIVLLETNTMPGMTKQSLYPIAAKENGMDMPDLCKEFVNLVIRDYKLNGVS